MGKTSTKEDTEQQPRKKSKFEGWDVTGPSRRTGHKEYFDSVFSTLPADMFATGTAPAREAEPAQTRTDEVILDILRAREGKEVEAAPDGNQFDPEPAEKEAPVPSNLLILKPNKDSNEKHKDKSNDQVLSPEISGEEVREYIDRWRRIIDGPAQLKMLEAIYVHTRNLGSNEFLTSGNHLAKISGLALRSAWKIVAILEKKGFLEKLKMPELTNAKGEGSKFRFNPYP